MFEIPLPCLIDLFGHDQIAGMVSEIVIGGSSFIRVDVPAIDSTPGFTKIFGPSAIYAIAPVEESMMLMLARRLHVTPVQRWMLPAPLRLVEAQSRQQEEDDAFGETADREYAMHKDDIEDDEDIDYDDEAEEAEIAFDEALDDLDEEMGNGHTTDDDHGTV